MTSPWRNIRKNIEMMAAASSEPVFLMVSGGVDSMFALDFCSRCDINFDVIHFDHDIRDDSIRDFDLIAETISKMNQKRDKRINIHYGRGQGLRGTPNQEGEAYNQRWAFVKEIVARYRNSWLDNLDTAKLTVNEILKAQNNYRSVVITAHHLNDNIEQALMCLMRGLPHQNISLKETNTDHETGMVRYRPFLGVSKSEILEQAEIRKLKWNEDSTNKDNHHERNWLRNVIIPQLMERRNLESSMYAALEFASKINY